MSSGASISSSKLVGASVAGVSVMSVKMLSILAPGPQIHRMYDGAGALRISRGTFVPRLPLHAPEVKPSGVRMRYSDLWCSSFPAPLRGQTARAPENAGFLCTLFPYEVKANPVLAAIALREIDRAPRMARDHAEPEGDVAPALFGGGLAARAESPATRMALSERIVAVRLGGCHTPPESQSSMSRS